MKLDWKKTFLIGLGFFGVSVMWPIYNSFVPLFLQAGRPGFVSSQNVLGFGLSEPVTGVIMGLDNIAALFILPAIGFWSDRVRTRVGRRYPFILSAVPVAAVSFVLLPIAARMIDSTANGSVERNLPAFILFMVGAILMLLAMAVMRTPIVSLMPDVTPSPLRSKANGVINFMGGVAFIIAQFALARLFDINTLLPFLSASAVLVAVIVLLFLTVKEPKVDDLAPAEPHEESEEEQALRGLRGFAAVPKESRRSLIFLMLAICCWFIGYDGMGTFFTSYAVNVLGVSEGLAPTLFGLAGLTFIIFAIPAGFIGERLGRRRTIGLGLIIFAVLLVIGYFVGNMYIIAAILGLGGIGWALININSLPMVVDTTDDERLVGTFVGFYYLASQFGSAVAPAITGSVINLLGSNYRMIFLASPFFFVLAFIFMVLVTRGEAHPVRSTPTPEAG